MWLNWPRSKSSDYLSVNRPHPLVGTFQSLNNSSEVVNLALLTCMRLTDKAHFLFRFAAANILNLPINQLNANLTTSIQRLEIQAIPKVIFSVLCDHSLVSILVAEPDWVFTKRNRFGKYVIFITRVSVFVPANWSQNGKFLVYRTRF